MKSEFLKWFTAQHGARERDGLPGHTDVQLQAMVNAGKEAERLLSSRERWDERRQSALYAWTARDAHQTPLHQKGSP